MNVINIPFRTSNRFIFYPLADNKVPTGFPLDFLLEAHFIVDSPSTVHLTNVTVDTITIKITPDQGAESIITIPYTPNKWCGYSNKYFILCSRQHTTEDTLNIEFSEDTVYIQPKSVTSFEVIYKDDQEQQQSEIISNDVKFINGYNIESIISDDTITINSIPGIGVGKAPCDVIPEEPGLRTINGVSGDSKSNLVIAGDSCIHITPAYNGIILNNRCVACCDCQDYWDILNHIHDINWQMPTFTVTGFGSTADGEYTYQEDGHWFCEELDCNLVYTDIEGIKVYQIVKDGVPLFTSAVTTGELPSEGIWYTGKYIDLDHFIDDIKVYKQQTSAHPWILVNFKIKYTNSLYSGIKAIYAGIYSAYDGNRESYKQAVYYWNNIDRTTPLTITGWLTPGSQITTDGFSTGGINYATLSIKVDTGTVTDIGCLWLYPTGVNDSYDIITKKKVYFNGISKLTDFTGTLSSHTKLTCGMVLKRPEAYTKDIWNIDVGYTIARVGTEHGLKISGASFGTEQLSCSDFRYRATVDEIYIKFSNSTVFIEFKAIAGVYNWYAYDGYRLYIASASPAYTSTVGDINYLSVQAPWDAVWPVNISIKPTSYVNIKAGVIHDN